MDAETAAIEAADTNEDLFEAVTHGKTPCDEAKATTIEDVLLAKDEGWADLQASSVEEQMAIEQAALAEAEAAVQ